MHHSLKPARSALAAALLVCAPAAFAQPTIQLFTLMSPPLPWAHKFLCTVTNVSNQSLTVWKAEIVDRGTVNWDGAASCTGALAPGKRCIVGADGGTSSKQPYCRVQYVGTEGALVASFYGDYSGHAGAPGAAVTAVPLQPMKTITLATAN